VGALLTQPHTFAPGDVVNRDVEFRLPDDLASGTYTLELAISGMAGTKGGDADVAGGPGRVGSGRSCPSPIAPSTG
jgi:hypothetical protein